MITLGTMYTCHEKWTLFSHLWRKFQVSRMITYRITVMLPRYKVAKQGNYWYHFYNEFWYDAVLDLGLNPGRPALEASTIPLGYRGGGEASTLPLGYRGGGEASTLPLGYRVGGEASTLPLGYRGGGFS